MIYVLCTLCAILLAILAFVIGYYLGERAKQIEIGLACAHSFLDCLEKACIALEKPQWFETITNKMKEINENSEDEE